MNIHVIGLGGNGSYLLTHLSKLFSTNQLIGKYAYTLKVYDPDTVEQKNLYYQNFDLNDIFEHKATATVSKYSNLNNNGLAGIAGYVKTIKNLDTDLVWGNKSNDIIISCVDNPDFREHLFKWQENKNNFWIDTRSEGSIITCYVKHPSNTVEYLLSTLPKERNISTSCQWKFDLENGRIQMGNRIIAPIACQYLLNYIRGISNPRMFTYKF